MTEACFNRIKVRRVRDILYAGNLHGIIDVFRLGCIMDPKVIHVKIEGVIVHLLRELKDIVREVIVTDSFILKLQVDDSSLR